jgi:enterochelin esterase-like enzyme
LSEPAPIAASPADAVLSIADPDARFRAVRLVSDLLKREPPRPLARRAPGQPWELHLSLPLVDRLEYQLQVVRADGTTELVLDPDAPTASGPFGPKSVLELSGYRTPAWLAEDTRAGETEPLVLRSERLRAEVRGLLWHPAGTEPDEPLPLLVVHDGPEYAEHAALLRYLASGAAPPVRAALLAPVRRNDHYGASPRYSAALAEELVPALGPAPAIVGLGASLGALALLHAHVSHPGVFDGLVLQSGSFFQSRTDTWEFGHPRFGPITRFVRRVHAGREALVPIPVGLTCGTGEENLANNRAMRNTLGRNGLEAELALVRDGHTWTCWRDGFDPQLGRLLARVAA